MDDQIIQRMIGRIYDSLVDPEALTRLAPDIASEFSSQTTLLYVVENPRAKSTDLLLSATANFDDWAHSSYTGYFRQRDVWSSRIMSRALTAQRAEVIHGL